MIVLYVLGYFNRNKQNSYAALIFFCCRFFSRWKESEAMQAESLHFTLDESQWQHDWAIILSLASQPGILKTSLIFYPLPWEQTV